jgi:MoaA/NifB/PqqE/SkfB family radical SAM enzyme
VSGAGGRITPKQEDRMTQYGFYGRLTAGFPSQLVIDSTEVCNLACVHCPHPEFKKSSHYAARYLDPELNAKLVDEVRDYGQSQCQYIRYTGEGEPLIHPHIYDMLDYAVHHSGVFVTLTTNGTIMNEKRIEKLLASGLHIVDTSIDAFTPETYAKIRVNGKLEVTRANVQTFLRLRDQTHRKTKIVVSYVEQPQNQHETADFEKFWRDQGADFVVIRRLHSNAGAVKSIADSLRREAAAEDRRPCLYPWERLLLSPEGHLRFCPEDWVKGSNFVDFRTTTVREAWQSDFMRALREAHLKNVFEKHPFCGQCPDWRQTRWPGEGRSYADMVDDFKQQEQEALA